MDNARIHHNKIFKNKTIENDRSVVYNIPCPKYNPIEYVFSTIKSQIKKADITTYHQLNKELQKIIASVFFQNTEAEIN